MKTLLRLTFLALALTFSAAGFAQTNPADAKKSYVHHLQLADRVRVAVYQEDDLTTLARIDARGIVNLPLVQEVQLGGMTIVEAQQTVEKAYREGRFLRAPQVTISVEEYAPREVSIQGQIRNPGRYPLPNESSYTIVELVTKAGGISDIGKGSAVTVTRFLPDGTKKVFVVDVDALIKGKKDAKADDNILLMPGDSVYVPERLI
ncbi:MAG: polysaccharide biosynthesis/export family protein [Opitutae bacterium]|nr:polysaccharide biosynthesis/export family protein [Opitutae bacterium]